MMLMRTDPFRDLDRWTQQVLGTAARPAVMPMDAWRDGDAFIVEFDLPGVKADSVDLDVERNVLTVHAERPGSGSEPGDGVRGTTAGGVQSPAVPGRDPRHRPHPGQLPGRGAAADYSGRREGQTAPHHDHQQSRKGSHQRLNPGAGRRRAIPREEVSEMTTDVLTETVLDEAEAIVRAEWVRLQRRRPARARMVRSRSEMPAARPRRRGRHPDCEPPTVTAVTAEPADRVAIERRTEAASLADAAVPPAAGGVPNSVEQWR